MVHRIAEEVRRVDSHFRSRGRGWYALHIIGVLLLSAVIAGGMFTTIRSDVAATTMSPLNNYRPKDFALIQKDGIWHVYAIYVCISQTPPCDETPKGLMHLTSKDLTHWTEEGYVIPPGSAGAWDSTDIWAPSVVENNGTYYMFYTGVKLNGSNVQEQKIGVATSTDLYTWTKSPSNPVLNCANFSWAYWNGSDTAGDRAACRDGNVQWNADAGEWMMTMSSRSATDLTPTAKPMTVGVATSSDLMTWNEEGYYTQTNGYTTESSHLVKHGSTWYLFWTDNCASGYCLKYSTSSSPYSGFSAKQNLTAADPAEYASEYYLHDGHEYFASVADTNIALGFHAITWTGTPFTLGDIPYGSISGSVWDDANGDGTQQGTEAGINNVAVSLYKDTGNDSFDPTTDLLYATTTTGDDPDTVGTQTGFLHFTTLLPGTYWMSIDPDMYSTGAALEGSVPSSGASVTRIVVNDSDVITNQSVGVTPVRTTWDFLDTNLFSTSGVTLTGGRAHAGTGSGSLQLAADQAIAFSRLQEFRVDSIAQGGAVHVVLSNDGGTTWMYWNGSAWAASSGLVAQSSTVADISAHAETFPAGDGSFLWRIIFSGSADAPAYLLRVGVTTNHSPATPTVVSPAQGATVSAQPQLRFSSTDVEHDGIQFIVEVDTTTQFSSANLRQLVQSEGQFGWTQQDTKNRSMYSDGTVATLQLSTALQPGTWYWRVAAIDPDGANRASDYSSNGQFVISTPVTLQSVSTHSFTASSARVQWTTNSNTSSWIQYGTTTSYGSQTSSVSASSHAVTLSSLTPGTTYHYRVVADAGNGRTIRSADMVFRTTGTTISGVTVSVTKNTATIRWTTTDASTTKVTYRLWTASTNSNAAQKGLSRQHSITLTGLAAGKKYRGVAVSVGATAAQSSEFTFTTKTK